MGKQRRKFEVGFKKQLVAEIELGRMTLSAAARQHQLSPSVIKRWVDQSRKAPCRPVPRFVRRHSSARTGS